MTALLPALGTLGPSAHAGAPPTRHAVIRFRGDLDAQRTSAEFRAALDSLDKTRPGLILIELTGNKTRPDLLFECARAVAACETPTAVWLADTADRTVGPGMLGLALAADHRGIGTRTSIQRSTDDDLTQLNPEIEDWAVVRLDLRSLARDLAEIGPLDRIAYESALAPRSPLWATRDENGVPVLTTDEPPGGPTPLVTKTADGWTFDADTDTAARIYRLPVHRTRRAFERALGARARPSEEIELDSGLAGAHARARTLVRRVRDAVRAVEAYLDVRAGRPATTRVMPHEYHTAAARARPLIVQSREAIAEIASLSDRYPELLHDAPPEDTDAPTELGGPTRTALSKWRDAVRDAEYDLARLEGRIEAYERR